VQTSAPPVAKYTWELGRFTARLKMEAVIQMSGKQGINLFSIRVVPRILLRPLNIGRSIFYFYDGKERSYDNPCGFGKRGGTSAGGHSAWNR
jgi:hypothetical protein